MENAARCGFTLIELSIVLVIIGLLAGAVMVGRELIAAATIRAAVSQIEQYKTAINTFRTKYDYLPGDIPAAHAQSAGLNARGGGAGDGNGNGVVEGLGQSIVPNWNNGAYLGGETVFFWTDLSSAQLIAENFTDSTDAPVTCGTTCTFSTYVPAFKAGRKAFVFAFDGGMYTQANGGYPYGLLFEIMNAQANPPTGYLAALPALTVAESSAIDMKMDDGWPITGTVAVPQPGQSIGAAASGMRLIPPASTGTASRYCVSSAATNPYNFAFPESVACNLVIQTRM